MFLNRSWLGTRSADRPDQSAVGSRRGHVERVSYGPREFMCLPVPELCEADDHEVSWIHWFRQLGISERRLVQACAASGIHVDAGNIAALLKEGELERIA